MCGVIVVATAVHVLGVIALLLRVRACLRACARSFFFSFLSFSDQLKEIGVVDEVIWEPAQGETHENFPIMAG